MSSLAKVEVLEVLVEEMKDWIRKDCVDRVKEATEETENVCETIDAAFSAISSQYIEEYLMLVKEYFYKYCSVCCKSLHTDYAKISHEIREGRDIDYKLGRCLSCSLGH